MATYKKHLGQLQLPCDLEDSGGSLVPQLVGKLIAPSSFAP